jgi:hypothetical protein
MHSFFFPLVLKKTIFDPMNLKFIVDKPTVPVVVYVVCKITSAVVLWKPEFNGGSNQEFYVFEHRAYHN